MKRSSQPRQDFHIAGKCCLHKTTAITTKLTTSQRQNLWTTARYVRPNSLLECALSVEEAKFARKRCDFASSSQLRSRHCGVHAEHTTDYSSAVSLHRPNNLARCRTPVLRSSPTTSPPRRPPPRRLLTLPILRTRRVPARARPLFLPVLPSLSTAATRRRPARLSASLV